MLTIQVYSVMNLVEARVFLAPAGEPVGSPQPEWRLVAYKAEEWHDADPIEQVTEIVRECFQRIQEDSDDLITWIDG